ncbi:hypothetical protein [Stygiolobus caldivivus]|uniref:Uncharacterized protein n=1 Tax=Stygiolobus caldivivus TaxID=2824673 RepID=A0A8D5U7J7_9CREN|nr:hypothetical protein [Stygiolobus caldivivus]BCU70789.1 hypothetical protein KN1_20860 [Stygiolobus caldivivus]
MRLEDFFRDIYVQTKIVAVEDKKLVMKCYNSSTSFKWYFISPSFRNYPYSSDPRERMNREINFLTYRWDSIKTPRIIDFDLEQTCLYREFIDGEEIKEIEQFEKLGKAIKYIHEQGFVMGDTKLENFIVSEGRITVIDAEQAITSNDISYRSWDLLVLSFSIAYTFIKDPLMFGKAIDSVYSSYGLSKNQAEELLGLRSIGLISLIPFLHFSTFRKVIEKYL